MSRPPNPSPNPQHGSSEEEEGLPAPAGRQSHPEEVRSTDEPAGLGVDQAGKLGAPPTQAAENRLTRDQATQRLLELAYPKLFPPHIPPGTPLRIANPTPRRFNNFRIKGEHGA